MVGIDGEHPFFKINSNTFGFYLVYFKPVSVLSTWFN